MSDDKGHFSLLPPLPLLLSVQGLDTLFLAREGIYQGHTGAPSRHFFGAGDI